MSSSGTSNLVVDIELDRPSKTYRQNESIQGSIVLTTKTDIKHDGIMLSFDGTIRLNTVSQKAGVLDSIASSNVKPLNIIHWTGQAAPPERVVAGRTKFPFELGLTPSSAAKVIYESYHGQYIMVEYVLTCELRRSFPNKSISRSCEICVEYSKKAPNIPHEAAVDSPVSFTITPDSVPDKTALKMANGQQIKSLKITGKLNSVSCRLKQPISGDLNVHDCQLPINSIDMVLMRIETCGSRQAAILLQEKSAVQSIQVANSDIPRNLSIPLFMLLPRYYTCATTEANAFAVEYELQIVITFTTGQSIAEMFPVTLHRW